MYGSITIEPDEYEFLLKPNLSTSYRLAKELYEKNASNFDESFDVALYAKHYIHGLGVERDFLKAYDIYYELEKKFPGYWSTEINRMVQNIMIEGGADIFSDGDFGPNSCKELRKRVGQVKCEKLVSRANLKKLISSFRRF